MKFTSFLVEEWVDVGEVDERADSDCIIIIKSMFTYISFHLKPRKQCPSRMRSQLVAWEVASSGAEIQESLVIRLGTESFQPFSVSKWILTVMSLVRNDYPKVYCFLRPKFFVVPLLFHSDSTICFNRHPRVLITYFECFSLRFLFQLEYVPAFGVTIRFCKLNAFCGTNCTSDATFLTWMLRLSFSGRFFFDDIFHSNHDSLTVCICDDR